MDRMIKASYEAETIPNEVSGSETYEDIKNRLGLDPHNFALVAPLELRELVRNFTSIEVNADIVEPTISIQSPTDSDIFVEISTGFSGEITIVVPPDVDTQHSGVLPVAGDLTILVPVNMEIEGGGISIVAKLDEAEVTVSNLTVDGHSEDDSNPFWRFLVGVFERLLTRALETKLSEQGSLQAAPSAGVPGMDTTYQVADSSQLLALVNQPTGLQNGIAICLDLSPDPGQGTASNVVNNLSSGRDYTVSFNGGFLERFIDQLWDSGTIPSRFDSNGNPDEDGDIHINSFNFELEDGKMVISGDGTYVDAMLWVDVDFDYEVETTFSCDPETYFKTESETEIDANNWDVLAIVILSIFSFLTLPLIVGAFGVSDLLSLLSTASQEEKASVLSPHRNLASPFNTGKRIESIERALVARCMLVHISPSEMATAGSFQFCRYFANIARGHREVHDLANENPNCQIDEIQKTAVFENLGDALAQSLNGCYYCLPEYHTG